MSTEKRPLFGLVIGVKRYDLATLDDAGDLLEVVEDRRGRSIIATSQLPICRWHEGLGDATVADAIMDRLLQRTHRLELSGVSRRRGDTAATPLD